MRKLPLILFLILGVACNKEDDPEKFTSFNGYWFVRTPDDSTTVTFRIGVDADNENTVSFASVRHNQTDYNSKPIDAGIVATTASEIESITILNNIPQAPFFVIRFLEITVNSDFTEMDITNSTFNIDGGYREFAMIKATRK